MSLFYWIDTPTDPASVFRGPWESGSDVNVDGELQVVPVSAEGNWFPRVEDTKPAGRVVSSEAWQIGNARVFVTFTPDPASVEEAAITKKTEIASRRSLAFDLGIPSAFNAITAQLRAQPEDFSRYGLIDRDHVPAGGVLVISITPIVGIPNNRKMAMVTGAAKIGKLLDDFTVFTSAADAAAVTGVDAVDDLVTGGATAEQIAAYDVSALPWPAN